MWSATSWSGGLDGVGMRPAIPLAISARAAAESAPNWVLHLGSALHDGGRRRPPPSARGTGHERDHDHATVLRHRDGGSESGTLRGTSAHRARAQACDQIIGASETSQRVLHRLGGGVGQVDEHAETVHLLHHLLAESGEPAVPRRVGGGVRPVEGLLVGEGHVPDAQVEVRAERAQGVLDRMAALHAEEAGDPSAVGGALDLVGRDRQLGDGPGIGRSPGGAMSICSSCVLAYPESQSSAGMYTDQNCPPTRPSRRRSMSVCPVVRVRQVVGFDVARGVEVPDRPRQVVVAVDHGVCDEHAPGALECRVLRVGRDGGEKKKRAGSERKRPLMRHRQ